MITDKNRNLYNKVWKHYLIPKPQTWPHWKIIRKFENKTCLEIGPGTRPKIPVYGNFFLDISEEAVKKLQDLGGKAYVSDLKTRFPFRQNTFGLVCGFEVLEHILDDTFVLKEINRVLKDEGICFVSFPLHQRIFNDYDNYVGHVRRYDPKDIEKLFKSCGFIIYEYATFSVPWPGYLSSKIIAKLTDKLPYFFAKAQEYIDSLPFSSVRKPLNFKKWKGNNSLKDFENENTAVILARKQSGSGRKTLE